MGNKETTRRTEKIEEKRMKDLYFKQLHKNSFKESIVGSSLLIVAFLLFIYADRKIYNYPLIITYVRIGVIVFFAVFLLLNRFGKGIKDSTIKNIFLVAMVVAIGFTTFFNIVINIYMPEMSSRAVQMAMTIIVGCVLFAGPIRELVGKILFCNLAIFSVVILAINGFSFSEFFKFFNLVFFNIAIIIGNEFYAKSKYEEFVSKHQLNEKLLQLNNEVHEKEVLEKELIRLASFDDLTNLYNRRQGLEILDSHFTKAKEQKTTLSICFMDIDNLKCVNDQYGHAEGDRYILDFIGSARKRLRVNDICIRMGGDEFLLVFPGMSHEKTEEKWMDIKAEIDSLNLEKGRHYQMSASHGIVEITKSNYRTYGEMIEKADNEMYIEKLRKNGRRTRSGHGVLTVESK